MTTQAETRQIIARLGGPVAVGRAVGRSHAAVCQWQTIPDKFLLLLEQYSRDRGAPVTREEMRPDLYAR